MKNIQYYRELTSHHNFIKGIVILIKRMIRKSCRFLIEPIINDINYENKEIWENIERINNVICDQQSIDNICTSDSLINNTMPYKSILVDNIVYFYNSHDITIPSCMRNYNMNWSKQDMENFINVIDNCFYKQNLKNGLFLDIGGNIGTTCIYVKKHLKPNFKFIAFEPVEDNYKLLVINSIINGFQEDIKAEYLGLSSKEKMSKVNINDSNRGGSNLSDDEILDANDIVVKVTTLDKYINEKEINITDIKFIWIDVEGHEPFVLEGAKEFLSNNSIPIFLEYNQHHYKKVGTYENMIRLLHEYFDKFAVSSQITESFTENDFRDIKEIELLWEELEHNPCDLILF